MRTTRAARSKALPWSELSSRLCLASDVIAASMKRPKNQAEPERQWFTRQSLVTSWWRTVGYQAEPGKQLMAYSGLPGRAW
jgi:hypothetical protein